MKKKSTIYDVAKIARVSPSTISRVMNTPEIVAEDTRQKVINAVKELAYIPNMMAASMPRRRTNYIGRSLFKAFIFPTGRWSNFDGSWLS
jgi:DNA-binding LacI/PurR family transcriptional regulator